MNKIDLIKEYRNYFTAKAKPEMVTKSVQMLHIGPFSTEPVTLKQIAEFIDLNKLAKNGLHHEIYLSDFRRTPPEKLKTILREPVK